MARAPLLWSIANTQSVGRLRYKTALKNMSYESVQTEKGRLY